MNNTRLMDLTDKQRQFAQGIAQGLSQADAYRKAYGTKAKPQRVAEMASRLASKPKVKAIVEQLLRAKEVQITRSQLSDKDRVLEKLRHLLDHGTKDDMPKLRAAELLGKSVGLFKDVVETGPTDNLSSEQLEAMLQERLSALLSAHQAQDDAGVQDEPACDPDEPESLH